MDPDIFDAPSRLLSTHVADRNAPLINAKSTCDLNFHDALYRLLSEEKRLKQEPGATIGKGFITISRRRFCFHRYGGHMIVKSAGFVVSNNQQCLFPTRGI